MIERSAVAIALAATLLACSSTEGETAPSTPDVEPDTSPMGGDRPVTPYVPDSYRSSIPTPLVILLHGYGASGLVQEIYFGLRTVASERGFVLLSPDGTWDEDGSRFWNATDSCCDFFHTEVDDSVYLRGLIDEAKGRFNIDPKRVFVMGHSNGGYMSYRMACDHADAIAGIASLAGAMYLDPASCKPSAPVAVLQMHGTADDTVLYEGGNTLASWDAPYPGARQTAESWAALNGCVLDPNAALPALDLVPENDGAETSVESWAQDCRGNGEVQLWTMHDEPHIPDIGPSFTRAVLDFLLAHEKAD